MALERFTGALNVGSQYAINAVGVAFNGTNKTLQRVLPTTPSTIATTILFGAASGTALCLARKAWNFYNAPAPVANPNPPAAQPAAVDGKPAPAAPADPAAPCKSIRWAAAAGTVVLVAASSFINAGLVGLYKNATLGLVAGAATPALFAAKPYLTAQAVALWNKFKGPALSAAEQAVVDAESALRATAREITRIQGQLEALSAKIDAAVVNPIIEQLLAAEAKALTDLKSAEAAVEKRWTVTTWFVNDNKTIAGLKKSLADTAVLSLQPQATKDALNSNDAQDLWQVRRDMVTAQARKLEQEASLNKARAEVAKKTPAAV